MAPEPVIEVRKIVTGRWNENCYVLANGTGVCLLVDPGDDAAEIQRVIESACWKVLAILNTHGHYDHVSAVAALKDRFDVPFYLHSKDRKLLRSVNLYRKMFGDEGLVAVPEVDHSLDDLGTPLQIGDFTIEIIPTPGHSPGGVCFLVGHRLFTGDTLFKGGVGRVDLPGGDLDVLRDSLGVLARLDPNTVVYPGHGDQTTIAEELEHNAALREVRQAP